MSGRVLIVDDEEPVRRATSRILERAGYECVSAGDLETAYAVLRSEPVSLVLCDIGLERESGLDLARHITVERPDTAVVMFTGVDDPSVAAVAVELGAYGYVIKPVSRNQLLINVQNALRRRALETENRAQAERLESLVAARTEALHETVAELEQAKIELQRTQEEMIERLSAAAEYKDPETACHLQRMSRYAGLLAQRVGFDEEWCERIRLASPMHDIGKIGIPDRVLLKPGAFDEEDRAIMSHHPEIGHAILGGSTSELLQMAASIALSHHERYDGSGYPHGLAGEAIPIEGRIVAIADVFDALTTARRYKDAFTFEATRDIMVAERGRHFDPMLLDLFLEIPDQLDAIRTAYSDTPARDPIVVA